MQYKSISSDRANIIEDVFEFGPRAVIVVQYTPMGQYLRTIIETDEEEITLHSADGEELQSGSGEVHSPGSA